MTSVADIVAARRMLATTDRTRPSVLDVDSFTNGMALLSAVFDRPDLPEAFVRNRYLTYQHLLADLSGEEFVTACRDAANQDRYFPKPAELRAHVRTRWMDREQRERAAQRAIERAEREEEHERAFQEWQESRETLAIATAAPSVPLEAGTEAGEAGEAGEAQEAVSGNVLHFSAPLSRRRARAEPSPEEFQRRREAQLRAAAEYIQRREQRA
jgi:hypothetical protein